MHDFICYHYHRQGFTDPRSGFGRIWSGFGPDLVRCKGQWIPEKRNASRVLFVWRNVFLDDISLLSVNDLRIKGDTFKYLLSTVPTIITTSKAAIINSHSVDTTESPSKSCRSLYPDILSPWNSIDL